MREIQHLSNHNIFDPNQINLKLCSLIAAGVVTSNDWCVPNIIIHGNCIYTYIQCAGVNELTALSVPNTECILHCHVFDETLKHEDKRRCFYDPLHVDYRSNEKYLFSN